MHFSSNGKDGIWIRYVCIFQNAQRLGKAIEVANLVEENNGLDALEHLQQHENDQVYSASVDIITQFFSGDDEEETGLEPEAASDVFVFGSTNAVAQQNQHIHF